MQARSSKMYQGTCSHPQAASKAIAYALFASCFCPTGAFSTAGMMSDLSVPLPAPVVSAAYSLQEAVNGSMAINDLVGTYYTDCVVKVNSLRAQINLPALQRRSTDESCTDGNAKYDKAHGAHTHFKSGSHCGGNGECECPGWPSGSVTKCMDQMWAEGPPKHGGYNHYSISASSGPQPLPWVLTFAISPTLCSP